MRGRKRKVKAVPPGSPVAASEPECPAHLDEMAREEWSRIVPAMSAANQLTELDRWAVASYCVAYSRHVRAEQKIAEEGEITVGPNGGAVQNPWLFVSNKAIEQMQKIGAQLGMSPTERGRVQPVANVKPTPKKSKGEPKLKIAS